MGLLAKVAQRQKGSSVSIDSAGKVHVPSSHGGQVYGEAADILQDVQKHLVVEGHEHFIRVPTGIVGLDEVMEGGLRKGTVNLVGGGAGCGKSILSMQYLVGGIIQYNEPGMYISFEENPEKI